MKKKATGVWCVPDLVGACGHLPSQGVVIWLHLLWFFVYFLLPFVSTILWPPSPGFSSASSSSSSCASGRRPFVPNWLRRCNRSGQPRNLLARWVGGPSFFVCNFSKKKKKGGKKLPPLFCRHFRLPPAQPSWNIFCFLQRPAPAPSVEALNMEIYLPPFSSKKKKTSRLEHWNFVVVGPFGRMNTAVGKRRKNSGRLLDFFWVENTAGCKCLPEFIWLPFGPPQKAPNKFFVCVSAARLQRGLLKLTS